MGTILRDEVQFVTVSAARKPLTDALPIAQVGPNVALLALFFLRADSHYGHEGVIVRGFPHEVARDGRAALLLSLLLSLLLRGPLSLLRSAPKTPRHQKSATSAETKPPTDFVFPMAL